MVSFCRIFFLIQGTSSCLLQSSGQGDYSITVSAFDQPHIHQHQHKISISIFHIQGWGLSPDGMHHHQVNDWKDVSFLNHPTLPLTIKLFVFLFSFQEKNLKDYLQVLQAWGGHEHQAIRLDRGLCSAQNKPTKRGVIDRYGFEVPSSLICLVFMLNNNHFHCNE